MTLLVHLFSTSMSLEVLLAQRTFQVITILLGGEYSIHRYYHILACCLRGIFLMDVSGYLGGRYAQDYDLYLRDNEK